jgi:hypothetical protein
MSNIDPIYNCFLCGKKLRYSGYKKAIVEIGSDLEHMCNPPSVTPRPKEIYLGSQSIDAKLAREYDDYFTAKKLSDLRTEAKKLEKFNKGMTYGKKALLMNSNTSIDWTVPNNRRRTK